MAQITPLGIDAPIYAAAAPTRTRPGPMIGEIIVELGFATAEQVDAAVEVARRTLRPTGKVLVADGIIKPDQLAQAVARRFGMDHVDVSTYQVDMAAANLVTPAAAKRLNAVPIGFLDKSTLLVATADPANVLAVDDIAMLTGYGIRPAVSAEEDIAALITRLNRLGPHLRHRTALDDASRPRRDHGGRDRSLVVERASADQIARLAMQQGMRRLRDNGLSKVQAGERRSPRSPA